MSDISPAILRLRDKWRYTGETRPPFAVEPGPGQESVWDYPRPPRIALDPRRILVSSGGTVVADSRNSIRVLETASPPVFYIPMRDVRREFLEASPTSTLCEWKGRAAYWSVSAGGRRIDDAAWSYPEPFEGFESMADYVSFYPAKLKCLVHTERVEPQPGEFYGGWVTSEIVGPFKGEPGTGSW
jgi:uncharacterized protein (DUF427 family)